LSDQFTPADDGDTLVKDVAGFVHAMNFQKPNLMGHSMGAATVMRVGAEYPDLARAIVMLDPFIGPAGLRFGKGGALRPPPATTCTTTS
jgi:pimeloyl-ACP methyl ester carboxylesterase